MRAPVLAPALALLAAATLAGPAPAPASAAEQPVAPYAQSPANAGGTPLKGDATFKAFHGKAGIDRIVGDLIDRNVRDPRIGEIFKAQDLERLHRLLVEQFCYLLGGPCVYTGRDMKTTHRDMGVQTSDVDALVENLQHAMDDEHVPFAAQNRLLSKLAPMRRLVVTR
jgi:hemoglobin